MSDKTPKIPQSKFFFDGNNHPETPIPIVLFVWGDEGEGELKDYVRCTQLDDVLIPGEREIIAAVARCAWMDIADTCEGMAAGDAQSHADVQRAGLKINSFRILQIVVANNQAMMYCVFVERLEPSDKTETEKKNEKAYENFAREWKRLFAAWKVALAELSVRPGLDAQPKTNRSSRGIEMERNMRVTIDSKLLDVEFTSAAQLDCPRALRKVLVNQPGYRRGKLMRLARAGDGSQRLYVLVDGRWMVASLATINY